MPSWEHGHYIVNNLIAAHYSDVIIGPMASQISSLAIVYPTYTKENINAARHWPLCVCVCGGGGGGIHRAKGQYRGKCFHLMTSPYIQVVLDRVSCLRRTWKSYHEYFCIRLRNISSYFSYFNVEISWVRVWLLPLKAIAIGLWSCDQYRCVLTWD